MNSSKGLSFENIQSFGRWRNRIGQKVPEFISEKNENKVNMLVNSCITKVKKKIQVSEKFCGVRPQEGGKHAVNKLRGAVTMNIMVEDSKRCNTATECEILNTVEFGEVMRWKALDAILFNKTL